MGLQCSYHIASMRGERIRIIPELNDTRMIDLIEYPFSSWKIDRRMFGFEIVEYVNRRQLKKRNVIHEW